MGLYLYGGEGGIQRLASCFLSKSQIPLSRQPAICHNALPSLKLHAGADLSCMQSHRINLHKTKSKVNPFCTEAAQLSTTRLCCCVIVGVAVGNESCWRTGYLIGGHSRSHKDLTRGLRQSTFRSRPLRRALSCVRSANRRIVAAGKQDLFHHASYRLQLFVRMENPPASPTPLPGRVPTAQAFEAKGS